MSEVVDRGGLDWVRADLERLLNDARDGLQAYAGDHANIAALDACVAHLHNVHSTLKMLELAPAIELAGEMELVGQALQRHDADLADDAIDVLMGAILEMPTLLAALARGEPTSGARALATSLRRARGAAASSAARDPNFAILLTEAQANAVERFRKNDGQTIARRVRAGYQQCLVSVLRNEEPTRTAVRLLKIVAAVQRVTRGTPHERLWWLFGAYLEAAHHVPGTLQRRGVPILRAVDRELRNLAVGGADALHRPVSLDLARLLLEHIIDYGVRSQRIEEALNAFGVGEHNDGIARVGREAVVSVARVLLEELAAIKDRLDLYVRSELRNIEDLDALREPLRRAAATLSVAGLGALESMVAEQYGRIELAASQGRIADDELMSMAEALMQVEEELRLLSGADGELGNTAEARRTVVREARVGLEEVKQAIVDFIGAKWDHGLIEAVPALLRAVRGGLDMIDLTRAAMLIDECRRYAEEELLSRRVVPDWETLDRLADAITSLDYYLERFVETRGRSDERVLDLAWESVESLGGRLSGGLPGATGAEARYTSFMPPVAKPLAPRSSDVHLVDLQGGNTLTPQDRAAMDDVGFHAPDFHAPEVITLEGVGAHGVDHHPGERVDESLGTDAPTHEEIVAEDTADALQAETDDAAMLAAQADALFAEPLADSPIELPIEHPIDDEILPVFLEETGEVLESIDIHLPIFAADLADSASLREIRRGFHTVKGSGRMVGANTLGELAWSIENLLNRILEGNLAATLAHLDLVRAARDVIPELRDAFAEGRRPRVAIELIQSSAHALASKARSDEDETADDEIATTPADVRPPAKDSIATAYAPVQTHKADEDNPILGIFIEESQQHLEALRAGLADASVGHVVGDGVRRAVHTLRGGAATVGADAMFQLADAFDAWLDGMDRWRADALALAQSALSCLRAELLRAPEVLVLTATATLLLQLKAAAPVVAPAEEFVAAPVSRMKRAPTLLAAWGMGENVDKELALVREDLAGAAAQHESAEVTEVALALVGVYDVLDLSQPPQRGVVAALTAGHEALAAMLSTLADGATEVPAAAEAVSGLRVVEDQLIDALSFDDNASNNAPGDNLAPLEMIAARTPTSAATSAASTAASTAASADLRDASLAFPMPVDIDPELLQIFLEEATELLEAIEQRIDRWRNEISNQVHPEHLLRALHTLKGGARLSGLIAMGDVTHEFEAQVQASAGESHIAPEVFVGLEARHDALARWLPHLARALVQPAPVAAEPDPQASATEIVGPRQPAQDARQPAQEMVRVAAGLLEQLVDLAGESAIARARISEVIGELGHVLDEMATTARRVRDQVRRLEIETEAQVLYRRERVDRPEYAEFDPLEMDRYSQLQQLTRGLTESASDLLDLQETIRGRTRETDSLLAHQARLHTALQEGLMRTRMVPFNRLVPRLNRIVRQIGQELGKRVELVVSAADGELDRSVLERMVPPLEHMLRNAVDHGIESADARRALGKPEAGRIQIRLQREASEIVIEVSDDGAGVDSDAVRKKAVSQGLMAINARLSDREVLGFIFAAGFSTASSVTQISGRGVGMDIVAAEVKQLGGSIDLQSERNRGTRFTIRLPFTVSVNRALMVTVGDDLYAVPLNSIEGIVRASPADLTARFATETPTFTYAGMDYRLAYLGSLLGRDHLVRSDVLSLPVLLTRSGDEAMAVHIDAVQGSREIVVKTLGPQFAGVSGVAGATLLGDGSVVVILDLPGLVRRHVSGREVPPHEEKVEDATGLCVMVVDDSVTVRKVTSRLLERQGMEVLLAKDGVEAVAQLQERRPDVILLDIEMPRMDGFEVAQQVRRDDRFGGLPIIMISSRTGMKHRDRAREIGVNKFLGKPFQESELLASIRELTGTAPVERNY